MEFGFNNRNIIEEVYLGDNRFRDYAKDCFKLNGNSVTRVQVNTIQEGDYSTSGLIRAVTFFRFDGVELMRSIWEGQYVMENDFPKLRKLDRRTVKMKDCPEADRLFDYIKSKC